MVPQNVARYVMTDGQFVSNDVVGGQLPYEEALPIMD